MINDKKNVLIVGSGISGLTCAIQCAEQGLTVYLVSQRPSEQSQSVLAAGGINAAINSNDTPDRHAADTIKSGYSVDNASEITSMCKAAPEIIKWLVDLGVAFTRTENGELAQRKLGGQSFNRTCYAGTSTGKQIVSALTRKCREYEIKGLVTRIDHFYFNSAILLNDVCYGAVFKNEMNNEIVPLYADNTVFATGGMNGLYKKTTGSRLNDAYAAAKLFSQGVFMKNLEFVQRHPTTVDVQGKKLVISEALRGEGGRLFYIKKDKRCYFMEDEFGKSGNLLTRDVVSKYVDNAPSQVYLDLSAVPSDVIMNQLYETYDLCKKYLKIDITQEPIPVETGVHYFMGGIYTDSKHETNIKHLYAIGECASKYHGANRLGGNSLLSAVYSGKAAALGIGENSGHQSAQVEIQGFDWNASTAERERIMDLLRSACKASGDARYESRGPFYRDDYPKTNPEFACSSLAKYVNGKIEISFIRDKKNASKNKTSKA